MSRRGFGPWTVRSRFCRCPGQVEQALGNLMDAITNYQHAIALAPNNAEVYADLGASYGRLGNWQGAQTAYEPALTIQSDQLGPGSPLCILL